MNADGSSSKALTQNALQNTEPKWSPDGKWIAYYCRPGIDSQICVISPDGQPAGKPIYGTEPVWSPLNGEGGIHLAFLCFHGTQSDICTVEPDGSNLLNLTNHPADEHSPTWSPDGKWMAFVSNRREDVDVYKMCLTCPGESMAIRLTDDVTGASWPTWSPDGNWIAYWDGIGGFLIMVKPDRSDRTYLASGTFGPPLWRPTP